MENSDLDMPHKEWTDEPDNVFKDQVSCNTDRDPDPEPETTIKDSGSRTTFQTGAVRDAQPGKGRRDLLPVRALLELSKHFEMGSQKYGDRNWEKGIPLGTYVNSAMNHLFMFLLDKNDEPHLTAAAWNIMCLLDTVIRIKEDTLPESLNTLPIDLDNIMLHWKEDTST